MLDRPDNRVRQGACRAQPWADPHCRCRPARRRHLCMRPGFARLSLCLVVSCIAFPQNTLMHSIMLSTCAYMWDTSRVLYMTRYSSLWLCDAHITKSGRGPDPFCDLLHGCAQSARKLAVHLSSSMCTCQTSDGPRAASGNWFTSLSSFKLQGWQSGDIGRPA